MPAENPLFAGKWSVRTAIKRLEGTVLNDILPELWFFTSIAVMVSCVNHYTDTNLQISNQMLTVLGTVLGLVISFRTTSAYDRFWEGRKLWGTISLASRNLAQIIWIHVPIDRPNAKGPDGTPLALSDARLRAILEKKSMVNLVQAFSVAVKHYLRSEGGIYYEDLYPLVSFLPQEVRTAGGDEHRLPIWTEKPVATLRRTASEPEKGVSSQSDGPAPFHDIPQLRPARNPPKNTAFDYFPPLLIFKPFVVGFKMIFKKKKVAGDEEAGIHDGQRNIFGKKRKVAPIDSNVPLEIVLFLSTYLQVLMKQTLIGPPIATAYVNLLTSMQDAVTNLERIRTTPIPFAYQTHLRLSVWLYLFFLPFEIHAAFKFLTIPATAFATFLYLGFLEIGQEIENPFNYDANDLDLDYFCQQIRKELSEITAHPAPDPNTYIFSMWNQPLAPSDKRTAQEIIRDTDHEYHEDKGIESVRGTLLRSWMEVSEDARQQRRFNLSGIQY